MDQILAAFQKFNKCVEQVCALGVLTRPEAARQSLWNALGDAHTEVMAELGRANEMDRLRAQVAYPEMWARVLGFSLGGAYILQKLKDF